MPNSNSFYIYLKVSVVVATIITVAMKASMGTTTTEATTMEEVTIADMELDGARDKGTERLLIGCNRLQQLPPLLFLLLQQFLLIKFNLIRNKDAL